MLCLCLCAFVSIAEFKGFFGDGEGAVLADIVDQADGDQVDQKA